MKKTTHPSVVRVELTSASLSFQKLDELRDQVELAQSDRRARVLVVALDVGRIDPENMGPLPSSIDHRSVRGSHGPGPIVEQQLIKALRNFLKPSIALIGPNLFDFAIEIAAACDIRIAQTDSTIHDSRVANGRTASSGIAYLLPRLVGLSQAMRISLLCEPLSASEALRIHFLHQVIEKENFDEQTEEFVIRVSKMPTRAWEVHKMQVLPQLDQDFETAMVHSLGIRQTHVIKDREEGIRAWRERRDPEFKGE